MTRRSVRLQDVRIKSWSAGMLGVGLVGAGLLGMVLTTSGTLRAQDTHDDAKPAQQEQPKDEAKPMQPNETKPETRPQDAKPKDDAKPAANAKQEDEKGMKPGTAPAKPAQDHAAQNNNGGHAMQASGHGQKIPEAKFRQSFGRQHTFRVQTTVVQGQPRFQYGGYWFGLGNSWPAGWAYTDDCYIDYIDGEYVLIDLAHPGVQIPLIVVIA